MEIYDGLSVWVAANVGPSCQSSQPLIPIWPAATLSTKHTSKHIQAHYLKQLQLDIVPYSGPGRFLYFLKMICRR